MGMFTVIIGSLVYCVIYTHSYCFNYGIYGCIKSEYVLVVLH